MVRGAGGAAIKLVDRTRSAPVMARVPLNDGMKCFSCIAGGVIGMGQVVGQVFLKDLVFLKSRTAQFGTEWTLVQVKNHVLSPSRR